MDNNVIETFKIIRSVYDGFEKNKRIKDVYYKKEFIQKYEIFLNPFLNYERKFLIFLSLCTIVQYGENNFIEFLKKMNEIKKNREVYFKFKNVLKNPKEFITRDINFILENSLHISKEEIFRFYQMNKISFYSFYFLAKKFENEFNTIEKIIFKRVDYLFKFIKYNIDENIFNIVLNKQSINLF